MLHHWVSGSSMLKDCNPFVFKDGGVQEETMPCGSQVYWIKGEQKYRLCS